MDSDSDIATDSTENIENDADSSSKSSEIEADLFLLDPELELPEPLDAGHPFSAVLPDLVHLGLRKWRAQTTDAMAETHPHDDSAILLACPYYRRNPDCYRFCLWQVSLHDMRTIKQHIIFHHRRPIYCPVCHNTFENGLVLNEHINARLCTRREAPNGMLDGIREDQIHTLEEMEGSTREHWLLISELLFPGAVYPTSIYLSSPFEQQILSFCEFWRWFGHNMVMEIVGNRALLSEDVDVNAALESLQAAALDRMIQSSIDFLDGRLVWLEGAAC